ncbi:hypothetical protein [Bradyrhizobium sp. 174]|uniref:hypothetical protein n=1 Tax=Bradyrhizobium sp. 174 TaxID=2782645 RepID=UPI001FF70C42|nr:hypothetical protein [Bradyrhizobium sp. 174]MCK1577889.1 hypothetical protein [Bradyrhizobium sp. 174]
MKLDRNINSTGRGKYGLVNNRKLLEIIVPPRVDGESNDASMVKLRRERQVRDAIDLLESLGILDWGLAGTDSEFFVIKLRDAYAGGALHTYASYAVRDGQVEYGRDVMELAKRSGESHPNCKKPD